MCSAKIQILDPIFKSINFCTTTNLLICTRETPNHASLSPTNPPLGISKKLKCIPLVLFLFEYHEE